MHGMKNLKLQKKVTSVGNPYHNTHFVFIFIT